MWPASAIACLHCRPLDRLEQLAATDPDALYTQMTADSPTAKGAKLLSAAGKADGKTKASPKRNGVAGRYLGTVTKGIKIGFAWPCPEGHRPTGQAQTELFYPRV